MSRRSYWISHCVVDHPCYSIRRKTEAEVLEVLKDRSPTEYSKPEKVYPPAGRDWFSILEGCLSGEDAAWWEHRHDAKAMKE